IGAIKTLRTCLNRKLKTDHSILIHRQVYYGTLIDGVLRSESDDEWRFMHRLYGRLLGMGRYRWSNSMMHRLRRRSRVVSLLEMIRKDFLRDLRLFSCQKDPDKNQNQNESSDCVPPGHPADV